MSRKHKKNKVEEKEKKITVLNDIFTLEDAEDFKKKPKFFSYKIVNGEYCCGNDCCKDDNVELFNFEEGIYICGHCRHVYKIEGVK